MPTSHLLMSWKCGWRGMRRASCRELTSKAPITAQWRRALTRVVNRRRWKFETVMEMGKWHSRFEEAEADQRL